VPFRAALPRPHAAPCPRRICVSSSFPLLRVLEELRHGVAHKVAQCRAALNRQMLERQRSFSGSEIVVVAITVASVGSLRFLIRPYVSSLVCKHSSPDAGLAGKVRIQPLAWESEDTVEFHAAQLLGVPIDPGSLRVQKLRHLLGGQVFHRREA